MNHEDTKAQRNTKNIYIRLSEREEYLAKHIVDIAVKIHKELGPGLLESVYAKCFYFELFNRNINYENKKMSLSFTSR